MNYQYLIMVALHGLKLEIGNWKLGKDEANEETKSLNTFINSTKA